MQSNADLHHGQNREQAALVRVAAATALEKAGIEFIGLMEEGLSVHFRAHRVPAIEESECAPCGAPYKPVTQTTRRSP